MNQIVKEKQKSKLPKCLHKYFGKTFTLILEERSTLTHAKMVGIIKIGTMKIPIRKNMFRGNARFGGTILPGCLYVNIDKQCIPNKIRQFKVTFIKVKWKRFKTILLF